MSFDPSHDFTARIAARHPKRCDVIINEPGGRLEAIRADINDVESITCAVADAFAVVNAVKAGLGVSMLPCFAAQGDATLARLTPAVIAHAEAFLVIPPDHRNTARVRLVMDAVTALFERERTMLEGVVPPGT